MKFDQRKKNIIVEWKSFNFNAKLVDILSRDIRFQDERNRFWDQILLNDRTS